MNDLPTVEAALKSPSDFVLSLCPLLGWTLNHCEAPDVAVCLTPSQARSVEEAMMADIEKATAYEAP